MASRILRTIFISILFYFLGLISNFKKIMVKSLRRQHRYSEISRTSLRSIVTYVSQRPFIFPGSVRDNILVGNPDATDEDGISSPFLLFHYLVLTKHSGSSSRGGWSVCICRGCGDDQLFHAQKIRVDPRPARQGRLHQGL